MDQNLRPDKATGEPLFDPTLYGKLFDNTRPNISSVVLNFSQFMNQPQKPHMEATTRVLKDIKVH